MKRIALCICIALVLCSCHKEKTYCWQCVNHTVTTTTATSNAIVDARDTSIVCGMTEENIARYKKDRSNEEISFIDPYQYTRTNVMECNRQ